MADEIGRRSRRRRKEGPSGGEAVRGAREQLHELIGRPVEQVLALERNDESNWEVLVQVVELERIPNTAGVKKQVAARRDEGPSVPTLAAPSVVIP